MENHIGKLVRKRREELGITQEELAKRLGYKSKSTINKIELGINDLRQTKITEFAQALFTTPAYLMGWEDEIKKSPELDAEVKQWELEGEFLEKFSKLSEGNKKVVMDLVDSLLKNQN